MLEDISNFLPLSETLLSSGMPTAAQMAEVAKAGVKVVINLAPLTSDGALPDEPELVESLGMQYEGIPVEWDHPTRQDLDQFMDAMDSNRGSRILVHCKGNYRATGFIFLYRILRQGWKRQEAFADVQRIWDPKEYPVWDKFIAENSNNTAS